MITQAILAVVAINAMFVISGKASQSSNMLTAAGVTPSFNRPLIYSKEKQLSKSPSKKEIFNELRAKEIVAWDALSKYKFIMFGYHAAVWVTLNRIHHCRQKNPFLDAVKLARVKIEKIRYPPSIEGLKC